MVAKHLINKLHAAVLDGSTGCSTAVLDAPVAPSLLLLANAVENINCGQVSAVSMPKHSHSVMLHCVPTRQTQTDRPRYVCNNRPHCTL